MSPVKFVVGLGNPTGKYAHTRHNLGWRVLDKVARAWQFGGAKVCSGGLLTAKGSVALFKPLTYMNESGRVLAELTDDAGVSLEDLLVVLDELNLPLASLRMRAGGSAGGHRGLESVIQHLGTDQFPRLRLGIGPPPLEMSARDFVLSPFDEKELSLVERLVERAALAAECWVKEGLEAAMSRYNGPVE